MTPTQTPELCPLCGEVLDIGEFAVVCFMEPGRCRFAVNRTVYDLLKPCILTPTLKVALERLAEAVSESKAASRGFTEAYKAHGAALKVHGEDTRQEVAADDARIDAAMHERDAKRAEQAAARTVIKEYQKGAGRRGATQAEIDADEDGIGPEDCEWVPGDRDA